MANLYSRCSRNTIIIVLINADTVEILCDAILVTMYHRGKRGFLSWYRGRRSTVAHSRVQKQPSSCVSYEKERKRYYTFPVALLWILSDQALASCYDLLVGRVNVKNWVHLPRIVGYRCPLETSIGFLLLLLFFLASFHERVRFT